jgi:hypothetical protein
VPDPGPRRRRGKVCAGRRGLGWDSMAQDARARLVQREPRWFARARPGLRVPPLSPGRGVQTPPRCASCARPGSQRPEGRRPDVAMIPPRAENGDFQGSRARSNSPAHLYICRERFRPSCVRRGRAAGLSRAASACPALFLCCLSFRLPSLAPFFLLLLLKVVLFSKQL